MHQLRAKPHCGEGLRQGRHRHLHTMANAAAAPENLFLLNSPQILDDRPDSFFYDLLRVARHVQR